MTINTFFSPQYCLGKSRASNPFILKVLRVTGKWGFPGEADPCLGWADSVLRGLLGYMTPRRCDPRKNRDPRVKNETQTSQGPALIGFRLMPELC